MMRISRTTAARREADPGDEPGRTLLVTASPDVTGNVPSGRAQQDPGALRVELARHEERSGESASSALIRVHNHPNYPSGAPARLRLFTLSLCLEA